MDQDAFRQFLKSSRQSRPGGKHAIPSIVKPQKITTSTSSGPEFKPRKVKKTESGYRDRAAERREGIGNDYADVEAVLDEFEKRVTHEDKDVIEEQRKYLGGDSQHTILVKGLDMSLLEQNRARAAATEDDEVLEQAFAEATSIPEPTEPRKRTREDIIRNLKARRQDGDATVIEKSAEDALEAAKITGKFRPIGFKPIGQAEEKLKKRKGREGKEGMKKKKKQKVEIAPVTDVPVPSGTNDILADKMPPLSQERHTTGPLFAKVPQKPPEVEPEPLDEDFDIFAGAGDYEGFPSDEESEEEHRDTKELRAASATQEAASPVPAKGWFDEPESEVRQTSIPPEKSSPFPEAEETPQEIGLKPLESSALPSIRDFLAMDEAVEKAEKRKARKEKKKKKKTNDDDDD